MSDLDFTNQQPFDPDGVIYCSSQRAQREALPVAILCHVTGVATTEVIDGVSRNAISLNDHGDAEAFVTYPVADIDLVERATSALKTGRRVVAYGSFRTCGKPRRGQTGLPNRFFLHSLHDVPRPSCLLGARPEDRARARALYEELQKTPDGLYQHIRREVIEILGAVPVWDQRYEDCLRLVVMQSLSQGMVRDGVNSRLSVAFYSDPSKGKRIFSEAANLLALVGTMVQPTGMSMAGMSAVVKQVKDRGWIAEAGAIPSSDGGCCIIDDLHKVPSHVLKPLQGLLMATLEDGKICSHKAASAEFCANTAILITANPQSVIDGKKASAGLSERLSNLRLKMDMLTRLDCPVLVDCQSDPAHAARMIGQAHKEQAPDKAREEKEDRDRRRQGLKSLIGVMLDEHPEVDLSPVSEPIGQMVDDMVRILRGASARLCGPEKVEVDGDIFLLRSANTVRKLIGASARLGGRAVANEEDLSWAWTMLSFKLEFIKWLCSDEAQLRPLLPRQAAVERVEDEAQARFERLQDLYGGQEPESIYNLAYQLGCGVRVLRRELVERGIEPQLGRYAIPTPAQYETIRLREKAKKEAREALGVQPVVRLCDELEPEAPVQTRDGGARTRDCIAPVPAAIEAAVRWIKRLPDPAQEEELSERLLNLVFEENDANFQGDLISGLSRGFLERYEGHDYSRPWKEMVDWLKTGDWATRSKAALSLYIAADLPDRSYSIKQAMSRTPDLPEETRQWLNAVLHRLQVRTDLWMIKSRNQEIAELRQQMAAMGMNSG